MGASLLVFIIYAAHFHNYILFFLPVGAEFQKSIGDASASSILISTPSTTTSTVGPTAQLLAQPTQKVNSSITQSVKTIQTRRINSIIGSIKSPKSISSWLSTLGSDGKWPDNEVTYTAGCAARRANWPAQVHWQRLLVMAGAWYGGVKGADNKYVRNQELRTSISKAMNYWFGRDLTNLACLDQGGTDQCPCTDKTMWNKNWYSNVILIPKLVGQICILLNVTLSPGERDKCTQMTGRSFTTFGRNLTGANTVDVAGIGIDLALLTFNVALLLDAYQQVHSDLQIKNGTEVDGINLDGAFGQHRGILYNGNYGKDYLIGVLYLEIIAGGTTFAAGPVQKNAFNILIEGSQWMIFRNTETGVLHWDFSVLGRFISFPVIDAQATGSIKIDLADVLELGELWSSVNLTDFSTSLSKNTTTSANASNLKGNRIYGFGYMVHRGPNYVVTLKMYSNRTKNTECTNSQNPYGFHLSDGVLYIYVQGNEYEDIAAAWDWNLIPGITVDYNATALICTTTDLTGIEAFVGGVSDGRIGIAVMRYTNPVTRSLHWQKAWFFLDGDVIHTMISGLNSTTSAPVYTVLDQRLHTGPVIVDGVQTNSTENAQIHTLWHGNVGYLFSSPNFGNPTNVTINTGEKNGSWSDIGTSSQPPTTVDLFTALIEHNSTFTPLGYTTFPGTSYDTFLTKSRGLKLQSIQNDQSISAIFDGENNTAMVVFWNMGGGSVTFAPSPAFAPITVTADGNIAIIYRLETGEVTVSDPSQTLTKARVTIALGTGAKPTHWGAAGLKVTLDFIYPSGGAAGSSVSQTIR